MLESKQKGIITQLQCLAAFNELGFKTSIPYGENSRYDFIVDVNNYLLRVQAKTSSGILNENGDLAGIKFACRSTRVSAQGNLQKKYTKNEIDYFCTFWDGICYVVPVEECSNEKTLRFFYPSNGQKLPISLAENYTIENQWKKYLPEDDEFEKLENNLTIISYAQNSQNKCIKCGKNISKTAKFCTSCSAQMQRIVKERPSREELKTLIKTLPFTQIAKSYNITDNAVRKWCDFYKLPRTKKEINSYSEEEWNEI